MNISPNEMTLEQVADKLQWGTFLYHVLPQAQLGSNEVKQWSVLVFDYDMEVVELFHKSQMLGQVVQNNGGVALYYEDYATSDSVYGITNFNDVQKALLQLSISKQCLATSIKLVATRTIWGDDDE